MNTRRRYAINIQKYINRRVTTEKEAKKIIDKIEQYEEELLTYLSFEDIESLKGLLKESIVSERDKVHHELLLMLYKYEEINGIEDIKEFSSKSIYDFSLEECIEFFSKYGSSVMIEDVDKLLNNSDEFIHLGIGLSSLIS